MSVFKLRFIYGNGQAAHVSLMLGAEVLVATVVMLMLMLMTLTMMMT